MADHASTALRWSARRSYDAADYPASRIADAREQTVSVCLPAKDCESTVGELVHGILALKAAGAVDELLVVAADDATALAADRAGALVARDGELLPEFGRPQGKGDAMWRSLSVLTGDAVCYVDGDTPAWRDALVCGPLGPLVCQPELQFVKGFFRRPFKAGDLGTLQTGGGRVTELTARPLLNLFWPDLAGFRQPLAGEMAGKRELFDRIPFATGYAIEMQMLLDAHREAGLWALAQCDLDVRQNAHKTLAELGTMAYAVLGAAASRLELEGRLTATQMGPFLMEDAMPRDVQVVERPPMASVRTAA